MIASADEVVDGGLRDAADVAELIYGQISLAAQFQYPLFRRLSDGHGNHLISILRIPVYT